MLLKMKLQKNEEMFEIKSTAKLKNDMHRSLSVIYPDIHENLY